MTVEVFVVVVRAVAAAVVVILVGVVAAAVIELVRGVAAAVMRCWSGYWWALG